MRNLWRNRKNFNAQLKPAIARCLDSHCAGQLFVALGASAHEHKKDMICMEGFPRASHLPGAVLPIPDVSSSAEFNDR
jgi:hypothetical protein